MASAMPFFCCAGGQVKNFVAFYGKIMYSKDENMVVSRKFPKNGNYQEIRQFFKEL